MLSKYLTIDEKLCDTCRGISEKFNDDSIPNILNAGINVLDGSITIEAIESLMEQSNNHCVTSVTEMEEIVKATGSLIWEFVKSNSIASITPVLQQVGFDANLAEAFGKVNLMSYHPCVTDTHIEKLTIFNSIFVVECRCEQISPCKFEENSCNFIEAIFKYGLAPGC
jgi:hypothetical protein